MRQRISSPGRSRERRSAGERVAAAADLLVDRDAQRDADELDQLVDRVERAAVHRRCAGHLQAQAGASAPSTAGCRQRPVEVHRGDSHTEGEGG